jgi:hypothetical protein
MSVDRATAEVAPRLRAAGIPCIVLKGPSHARWLYEDPHARTYGDCDLLVPPGAAERVESLLAEVGFARRGFEAIVRDRPRYGFPLYRADNVSVDVHTTFVGVGVPPEQLWAALSARVEPLRVAGEEVSVLEPVARSLVLVLHAAKDGGKRQGRGVKAIRDLELAIERISRGDWQRAADLASELDAVEAFSAGLRRVEPGEALAVELGLPSHLSPEVALRLEQPPPLAVGLDWLFHGDAGIGRIGVVARKMFPPPAHLRAWSPLARRGPVGMGIAYVARPFWVAWKIIPAIRAVIRARRVSDRS